MRWELVSVGLQGQRSRCAALPAGNQTNYAAQRKRWPYDMIRREQRNCRGVACGRPQK